MKTSCEHLQIAIERNCQFQFHQRIKFLDGGLVKKYCHTYVYTYTCIYTDIWHIKLAVMSACFLGDVSSTNDQVNKSRKISIKKTNSTKTVVYYTSANFC